MPGSSKQPVSFCGRHQIQNILAYDNPPVLPGSSYLFIFSGQSCGPTRDSLPLQSTCLLVFSHTLQLWPAAWESDFSECDARRHAISKNNPTRQYVYHWPHPQSIIGQKRHACLGLCTSQDTIGRPTGASFCNGEYWRLLFEHSKTSRRTGGARPQLVLNEC